MSGNMYPGVKTWNPLAGRCKHECDYCSTEGIRNRYDACMEKYNGEHRLYKHEFKNLGKGKTIFVCAQNDLFEESVPSEFIEKVLEHTRKYRENIYMFQTKNPERYMDFFGKFPTKGIQAAYMLGTTIETNREDSIKKYSKAPSIESRIKGMVRVRPLPSYVTIEPIMDFDLSKMASIIRTRINPNKVYVGADSKNNNLPEPSKEKIQKLIGNLREYTEVEIKSNLNRIMEVN